MISFQGLQYKTVKITEINPAEELAFTHCTAFIVEFIFLLLYFNMKLSSVKVNRSLRTTIESCVRVHKRKIVTVKYKRNIY